MRILKEDESQLIFNVYPQKFFLWFSIFILPILLYGFFRVPDSLLGKLLTALAFVLWLSYTVISYFLPLHVKIDKVAKTITYQYFIIYPNQVEQSQMGIKFMPRLKKIIPLDKLQKIVYTNNLSELGFIADGSGTLAKYSFILKEDSSINIYAGIFTMLPHRYACMKIAEYLKIPYKNSWDEKKEE